MAIFATDQQLNLLRHSKTLIFDGSFKFRPQDTYQIYRGFGFIKETHCIPVLTVLLRGKDRELYAKMWKKVDEAIQPLGRMRVKIANFDCEPAAWKSFRVQFPKVKAKMCVFHTKQALNRKVQALGLMPSYIDDPVVSKIVRQIGALQLTPPEEWKKCLLLLKEVIENSLLTLSVKEKLVQLLEYYKTTWIKLGKSFFSMFGVKGPRTSNPAESYHGRQQYHFRKKARLGEWIVRNRELHYREQMEAESVLSGRVQPNQPKPKYDDITAKLLQRQTDLTDFLLEEPSDEEYKEYMLHYLKQAGALMGYKAGEISGTQQGKVVEEEPEEVEPVLPDKENEAALKAFDEAAKEAVEEDGEVQALEPPAKKRCLSWEVKPTTFLEICGDGNCLYRSIAHFVKGSQQHHLAVREELMGYLLFGRYKRWAGIFGSEDEISEYVEKHRKAGEFGRAKELILAARLYQVNFALYKPEEKPNFIAFSADYERVDTPVREDQAIRMIRHRGEHFDVALE